MKTQTLKTKHQKIGGRFAKVVVKNSRVGEKIFSGQIRKIDNNYITFYSPNEKKEVRFHQNSVQSIS